MITANFSAYASYVTDSLYQWDINQVLSVSGLNLSVVPEVHFSNAHMDKAIVRQAAMSNHVVSVNIPNSLLQYPLTIYAHIGIYEGTTFKVVEVVEIPVIARKRPNDYQIENTDGEIYSFKALENAIANMTTKTEASVISARIDNIIANNNDTEGNTELVDIRTAVNGFVYGSAGSAVRNQFLQLQDETDKLKTSKFSVNVFDKNNATIGGYLNSSGVVTGDDTTYGYTDLIEVNEGDVVMSLYSSNLVSYPGCLYYSDGSIANIKTDATDYVAENSRQSFTVPTGVVGIRLNIKTSAIDYWMIVINNDYPTSYVSYEETITLNENVNIPSNILSGKTWVVCGDSITYGAEADLDDNGDLKTYEYYIGKRNNMNLVIDAISGSTMMNVSGKSPFSVDRYKNLGKNADYITLAFVTNDSAQDTSLIGDIDDENNTTFYGAWNVVLKYLIETYPLAKIGIIGFWRGNQCYEYTDALRNIAKKYRIPFLDFMFDEKIPLIGGTDFRSYNPNAVEPYVDYDTLVARKNTFLADDVHPNDVGYQYLSTIIENWLRSL